MSFLKKISSDSTDEQLLEAYKATGNTNVLVELYQRYMDLALGVCFKYLNDREAAKDAVMEVYEQLPAKVNKHDIQHFKSWLYTVVKNYCLMLIRSAKPVTVQMNETFMQSAEELHQDSILVKESQLNQMSSCIETLVNEQRQAIELFYLQQKCYNEIVQLTGFDWNKVRSLIQNGKRNLKICMENSSKNGYHSNG